MLEGKISVTRLSDFSKSMWKPGFACKNIFVFGNEFEEQFGTFLWMSVCLFWECQCVLECRPVLCACRKLLSAEDLESAQLTTV